MDPDVLCKVLLLILMTQIGKTFQIIRHIVSTIPEDIDFGRSVHIIFTMNTLLNNKQFAKRLDQLELEHGVGSICILSSKDEGKYKHVKNRTELQGLCLDEQTCPRIIVMCSNRARFDDGLDFIKVLNTNNTCIKRVLVYFDELHKYLNSDLRKQIEDINLMDIVETIIAMTATPNKIFQNSGFWSSINTIYLDNYCETNYAGYKDMIFHCIDDYFPSPYKLLGGHAQMDNETIGFIEHILKLYPNILGQGTRTFIPASIRRVSHERVRELVFNKCKDALVVVLNGYEKTLLYRDQHNDLKMIDLKSTDEEVSETIARNIIQNKLVNRPLVITGFLCVGMGQTLSHKKLGSFTSAIFSHLYCSNDDIYQLFGRITGRMKDWGDKYVQTQVYCPSIIKHRCYIMEECARNIMEEFNGQSITKDDYMKPVYCLDEGAAVLINQPKHLSPKKTTVDLDKDYKVFDNQDEAIAFGCNLGIKFNKRKTMEAPKEVQVNGHNPTVEDLIRRWWGISDKNRGRMIPTDQNKWCVYWRPSLIS